MPEPITTIGLGVAAAYVSKDIVLRLLGPTADYWGAICAISLPKEGWKT
jgi:hypothetical protein